MANRVQKVRESGNIKLGQVASDVLGARGRAMLWAVAKGETQAEKMAELAHGRLQSKKPDLQRALVGRLTKAQRWGLGELLTRYEELEAALTRVNEQIRQEVEQNADPFVDEAVKLLDTGLGIGEQIAQSIVSELGVDRSRFPSEEHLSSWAGMCPGNHQAAGKRKSGRTTKGSPYLRAALVQAAWAASHTKGTYLSAQYQRLVKRMGKKKALVAVGHSILVIIYHVLKRKERYRELGGDYFDRHHPGEAQRRRLIRKLEALGLRVTVEEITPVA